MLIKTIITSALVEIGAVDSTENPTGQEMDDGLAALNRLLSALRGNGIGPSLKATDTTASASIDNGRSYMCGNTTNITLTGATNPQDGDRFGVNDARKAFGTHSVTLDPNGRLIGDATSASASTIVLSTNGDDRKYTFIVEAGWMQEKDFAVGDTSYFADEVNEALVYMLAGRLCIQYDMPVSQQLADATVMARATLIRRYGRKGKNQKNPPIGVVSASATQKQPVA